MKILLGKQFQPLRHRCSKKKKKTSQGECESPSWEPLLSDVGRKPQSVGPCGGRPPMSVPPPFFSPSGCSWRRHNAGAWEPAELLLKTGGYFWFRKWGESHPVCRFFGPPFALMPLWAFICLRSVLGELCAVETDAAWESDRRCIFSVFSAARQGSMSG